MKNAHAAAAGDRLADDIGLTRDDPRRTEIRAAIEELILIREHHTKGKRIMA